MRTSKVALYAPNLIGYFRLLLLGTAILTGTKSCQATYWLFVSTLLLDGLDGFAARRLQQCSSYGAFLDVFIDNLTRGVLWTWGAPPPYGVLPVIIETTVFTCTHKVSMDCKGICTVDSLAPPS
ncbi:hypothetical protein ABBQ32_009368 [Trebouxia sp. C0010 RCD-2024]